MWLCYYNNSGYIKKFLYFQQIFLHIIYKLLIYNLKKQIFEIVLKILFKIKLKTDSKLLDKCL